MYLYRIISHGALSSQDQKSFNIVFKIKGVRGKINLLITGNLVTGITRHVISKFLILIFHF